MLGRACSMPRNTYERTPFALYNGSGVLEAFVAGHMQRTSFALHNASDAHAQAAVFHAAALMSALRSKLNTHQRKSFALYNGSGVPDALNPKHNATHVIRVI